MSDWWSAYWPWIVTFAWLVGYELAAIVQQATREDGARAWPTLSQQVWRAHRNWPALQWVVLAAVGVLLWHFFWP